MPTELSGQAGVFRCARTQCRLSADEDQQAIQAWLQSKHKTVPASARAPKATDRPRRGGEGVGVEERAVLSNTQRAYRKEAERLLLWAVLCRAKALSSLNVEDCAAYLAFLADPQPRERWCGVRVRERASPQWRPFEGPLSPAAQRQAVTVLKAFYGFLVRHRYVTANPWSAIPVAQPVAPVLDADRSLTVEQWRLVEEQLRRLPKSPANARLSLATRFLYATGLRSSEICAAKLEDLRRMEPAGVVPADGLSVDWVLKVEGKGQRMREVPVPAMIMDELGDYLRVRGLHPDPHNATNHGVYLLGRAWKTSRRCVESERSTRAPRVPDQRVGLATTTLYDQLRVFFETCAQVQAGKGDRTGAQRLARASTHWLRHSHARHAIAAGAPLDLMQEVMGHASLVTTSRYVCKNT